MNTLEDLLLIEMSRRNTDAVVDIILQKKELFAELFSIFAGNTEPASRRAAWVIDLASEKEPELIAPYLDELAALLPVFRHDGLKRHTLRILARSPLPSGERLGRLVNLCFEWLLSPQEAVAAKVCCMDLLYRVSLSEPDIRQELADSIEYRMLEESPGFRNRAQKMLSRLFKEPGSRG